MDLSATDVIAWKPQRPVDSNGHAIGRWPQFHFLRCPADALLFGGARGGSKTDSMLGFPLARIRRYGDDYNGILFRRSFTPELEEIIRRSHEIYTPLGAKWNGRGIWRFGRATLRFRHLERLSDAANYQGHSYTDLMIDEMGGWRDKGPIDLLKATLRSAAGVPTRFRASANPGGVGHHWIKKEYIDPCPLGWKIFRVQIDPDDPEAWESRCYIPATLDDNPALIKKDPRYWMRIKAACAGNKELEKAWRYGLWDVIAGGYFSDVWERAVHVIKPFTIPHTWRCFRALDWGDSAPFSVGWWAVSDGTDALMLDGTHRSFPRGTMFRISEWYGCKKDDHGLIEPNQGIRMSPHKVGRGIREREHKGLCPGVKGIGRVEDGPADNQIFDTSQRRNQSYSIAKEFEEVNVYWRRSNKSPGSRVQGWKRIHSMLNAAREASFDEPHLYAFETTTEFIRTVPMLPRDTSNIEDIDTDSEDHPADESRYAILFAGLDLHDGPNLAQATWG